jgi:hypothetical protein
MQNIVQSYIRLHEEFIVRVFDMLIERKSQLFQYVSFHEEHLYKDRTKVKSNCEHSKEHNLIIPCFQILYCSPPSSNKDILKCFLRWYMR